LSPYCAICPGSFRFSVASIDQERSIHDRPCSGEDIVIASTRCEQSVAPAGCRPSAWRIPTDAVRTLRAASRIRAPQWPAPEGINVNIRYRGYIHIYAEAHKAKKYALAQLAAPPPWAGDCGRLGRTRVRYRRGERAMRALWAVGAQSMPVFQDAARQTCQRVNRASPMSVRSRRVADQRTSRSIQVS